MKKVIFACVHNAGRSQMAAAFFNRLVDRSRFHGVSAGTQPATHVHGGVIDAMREVGIDLSNHRPQLLTDALAADAFMIVTMGCGDACPVVPGARREDWPLADPKDLAPSDVARIRDEIETRVRSLVGTLG